MALQPTRKTAQASPTFPSIPKTDPAELGKMKAAVAEFQSQADALQACLDNPRALSKLSENASKFFEQADVQAATRESQPLREQFSKLVARIEEVKAKARVLDGSSSQATRKSHHTASEWFKTSTEAESVAKVVDGLKKTTTSYTPADTAAGRAYVEAYKTQEIDARAAAVKELSTERAALEARFTALDTAYRSKPQDAQLQEMGRIVSTIATLVGRIELAKARLAYARGAVNP